MKQCSVSRNYCLGPSNRLCVVSSLNEGHDRTVVEKETKLPTFNLSIFTDTRKSNEGIRTDVVQNHVAPISLSMDISSKSRSKKTFEVRALARMFRRRCQYLIKDESNEKYRPHRGNKQLR